MSDFLSNIFGSKNSTQIGTKTGSLGGKLLVPVMVATSLGLLWKFNTLKENMKKDSIKNLQKYQEDELKKAHKMIAGIPLVINNLHEYTFPEIQAITRRNTIKNKLIGRKWKEMVDQNIIKNNADESLNWGSKPRFEEIEPIQAANPNKELSLKLLNINVIELIQKADSNLEIKHDDKPIGSNSIMSTSSVETNSSESWIGGKVVRGILKRKVDQFKKNYLDWWLNSQASQIVKKQVTFDL